jgi:hypothetical protein
MELETDEAKERKKARSRLGCVREFEKVEKWWKRGESRVRVELSLQSKATWLA